MVSHLKTVHKKSAKEAVTISKLNRAVKKGTIQKNKPFTCPVPGCSAHVVRVDLHLRRIHKLDRHGEDYKRLDYYDLLKYMYTLNDTQGDIDSEYVA